MSYTVGAINTRLDYPWNDPIILNSNGQPWAYNVGYREMRERSRRLESESALAYAILERSTENVIGTMIGVRPKTDSDEFNKEIGDLWNDATSGKHMDVRRMYGFGQLQRFGYRSTIRDGDCGYILIDRTDRGYRWPELQFIEGHLIETPSGKFGRNIHDGIEFDSNNTPVAYWIKGEKEPTRVEARDFVFLHHTCRYNVGRGQPAFHGTYRLFDQLEGHIEAVVVAARIAASQAMIAKRKKPGNILQRRTNNNETTLRGDGVSVPAQIIEPGMINYVDIDEDLVGFNPTQPHQDFKGFVITVARFLGLKFGLTVERVLLDFSSANYSVSRSTALQEQKAAEPKQQEFDAGFLARVYPWFVSKMVNLGRTKTAVPQNAWAYEWIPQGRPLVEPSKEAPGLGKLIELGLETPEYLATERGYDWNKLLATAAKNKKELESIGIAYPGSAAVSPGAKPTAGAISQLDGKESPETVRTELDTYGIGVRASVITPNIEDEEVVRRKAGLPPMNENVKEAWRMEGGIRRPITVQQDDEVLAQTPNVRPEDSPASDDDDEPDDDTEKDDDDENEDQ